MTAEPPVNCAAGRTAAQFTEPWMIQVRGPVSVRPSGGVVGRRRAVARFFPGGPGVGGSRGVPEPAMSRTGLFHAPTPSQVLWTRTWPPESAAVPLAGSIVGTPVVVL